MGRQIIWSDFAIQNLKEIFDFWKIKSNRKVAEKIRNQILNSAKQLLQNPESGPKDYFLEKLNQNHRFILSGAYKIIYRIEGDNILIQDVFDVRQNPSKMADENRN